jgi:GH25 family lysozyme M1 (1,4-beta-N-acetylmuramidase)
MTNVAGEDRSSFQAVQGWGGDSFAFAKATEGTGWHDPAFARNWGNAQAEGKVRGAYHFFHPAEDPVTQAEFFMTVVREHGLADGDVLIADVEITVGTDRAEYYGTGQSPDRTHQGLWGDARPDLAAAGVGPLALAFLEEVQALAGPGHKVLLYTDLFMAQNLLGACTRYPLFIAYYDSRPPASVSPWGGWAFWQTGGRGPGGGDADYFNGDLAALQDWASPAPSPLPPNWTYPPVRSLTARGGDTSVRLQWNSPAPVAHQEPMPAIGSYEVAVAPGPALTGPDVAGYPRYVPKGANPEDWQGGSLARRRQYTAGVRAIAAEGGHAGPWATVTFSTT